MDGEFLRQGGSGSAPRRGRLQGACEARGTPPRLSLARELCLILLVLFGLFWFSGQAQEASETDTRTGGERTGDLWDNPVFERHDWQTTDGKFTFKDFLIFRGQLYYTVRGRLRNNTANYVDWVKVTVALLSGQTQLKSEYTYIDFETYGYSGMTPGSYSYFETMLDIVNFSAVKVTVEYQIKDGSGPAYEPRAMQLVSSNFTLLWSLYEWKGAVKNVSLTPLKFPKILVAFYQGTAIKDFDYTYLDTPASNTMAPGSTCGFTSYVDRPTSYTQTQYVLHYSVMSTGRVVMPGSGVEVAEVGTPTDLKLVASYPNPFNEWVTIRFVLPRESEIEVKVYNVLGGLVAEVFKGRKPAGQNEVLWNGQRLPSGNYVIELVAEGQRVHSLCSMTK